MFSRTEGNLFCVYSRFCLAKSHIARESTYIDDIQERSTNFTCEALRKIANYANATVKPGANLFGVEGAELIRIVIHQSSTKIV